MSDRNDTPRAAARKVTWAELRTTEPGHALYILPPGWHVWAGPVTQLRGGQWGRRLIIRSDRHAEIPAGWHSYDPAYECWPESPVTMTEDEADLAGAATPDSAALIVALRENQGRWTISLGVGGTTRHLPGSYPTAEAAEHIARAAVGEEYLRQVDAIRRERGGTLDWGLPIAPPNVTVLRCRPDQSGWDAMAEQRDGE